MNIDWYGELVIAAESLFDKNFDKNDLELNNSICQIDGKLKKYYSMLKLKSCNNKTQNVYQYIDSIREIKEIAVKNLDFNSIKFDIGALMGVCLDFESCAYSNNAKLHRTPLGMKPENRLWAVALVIYIQDTKGNLSNRDFALEFTELTKFLREEECREKNEVGKDSAPPDSKIYTKIPTQTKDITLILFFGQSHKPRVNEIKDKEPQQLTNIDYDLLGNKCEWFWCGASKDKPSEIANGVKHNICWLQLDMKIPSAPEVKNLLDIKDLIKTIRNKPTVLTKIVSGDSTFDLDDEVFSKI